MVNAEIPTENPIQDKPEDKDDVNVQLTIALNQLVQGKRSLVIRDFNSAVESLEEACQTLDEVYGSGAPECGEAYLFYGIARLEIARQETGALDGTVEAKMKEQSDEDEESEDEEEGDEGEGEEEEEGDDAKEKTEEKAEDEENKAESNGKIESKGDTEEELDDDEVDAKPIEVSSAGPSSSSAGCSSSAPIDADTPSTSTGVTAAPKEEEEDAEATDMEIAWTSLDAAATIFKAQVNESKEMKLRLAEALQKLGEISIEWENNEHSLQLLEECLALRKECLPEDDRLIAETYYHIGIAFSFMSQIDKANDCFRSVIGVIEKRIESKKKLIAECNNAEEIDKAEKEVVDLQEILKDMAAKIEDSQDQMNTMKDGLKQEENERLCEQAVIDKIKQTQAKPITDISHLVKRKRPADPAADLSPSSSSKKSCNDVSS